MLKEQVQSLELEDKQKQYEVERLEKELKVAENDKESKVEELKSKKGNLEEILSMKKRCWSLKKML